MSDQESPIYLVLSFDNMSDSQIPELDMLTKEIGLALENETRAVKSISYVNRETLPAGAKVAELIFPQQMIMQILPIVTPWALAEAASCR